MIIKMVESKYTHVKVNNEIELCEVYERETKEQIKKAFFGAGVSFFIKCKKTAFGRDDRYVICVNSSQKNVAKTAILRKIENVREKVNFFDGLYFMEGRDPFFKRSVITESTSG